MPVVATVSRRHFRRVDSLDGVTVAVVDAAVESEEVVEIPDLADAVAEILVLVVAVDHNRLCCLHSHRRIDLLRYHYYFLLADLHILQTADRNSST